MKYITKLYFLLFIASFIYTPYAISQSNDIARIAVIGNNDISSLAALLEVELSQNEGIQLLERAAIDKILEEQKLSAAGLLDRNNTIKIGKLLRADAFIILSTEISTPDSNTADPGQASSDLIRVRVSETAHGLRLLDCFAQSDSNSVGTIVQKLESVFNKINQPDEKLIPIGIVDIHRVQLAEQYKMLERTLPVLLSVRLNLEPQIIMLEREDLKVLLDEKLMTEGEDTKFWSSAILIDGYIQPNNGQLELHLNLKQAAGENLKSIIVPVEPNEAVVSIDKASTKIIEKLQDSTPTAKWNPELEAELFYKQGQLLSVNSRYEEALPLFETAHALQPQNVYYTGEIFNNEWNIHKLQITNSQIKANTHYSDLELADLVFLYVRQIRDSYKNSIINDAYLINTLLGDVFVDGSLGCSSLSISHLGYFGNSVSVSTDKIKEINRNSRKIWSETLRKARLPWKQQLFLAWCETDDFNQVIENTRTIYRNQNNLVAKDNYVFKRMFWEEVIIFSTSRHFNELEYTQFKDTQQQCLKIWLQFLHELEEATDPYAKLFSCIALYEHYAGNSSQKEKYRKKIISIYRDEFHTPNEPFDTQEKYIMRYEMKRFMTIEDYAEILESLIQKKDAANLIIWSPGYASPTYSATPEATEQYYKLLEKSVEIIKDFGNAIQVLPNLSNSQVLNYILDKQLKLRQNYPNATFAIKLQTEIKANMILKVVDWAQKLSIGIHGDSDKDIKSVIYENNLWVAFMSSVNKVDEKELYLAGINLDKKELIALWQTRIPFITTPVRYETLSGISVNKDITYVSLCGSGIIEFPGSFKTGRDFIKIPVIHNQDQGIPSVFITSMTKYENKLYIAYGSRSQECGIGLYNLQNKNWECLFSSTIKGPVPFHIGNTFIVSNLTFKSKNEILFSVILPSTSYSLPSSIYNGLWKLDLTSKNLKMVVSSYMSNTEVEPVGSGEFPEKYLFKKEDHIFEFDTKSEKSKYLIGSNESINNLQTQYQNYPKTNNTKVDLMKSDFFIPESLMANFKFGLYRVGMIDLLTATIYNNKLWARYGESQIIIIEKGKSFEDAQIIDNNILDGGPVERFVSTPYGLVGIGEGTVGIIETEDMGK